MRTHRYQCLYALVLLSCVDARKLTSFGCEATDSCGSTDRDSGEPSADAQIASDGGAGDAGENRGTLALLAGSVGGPGALDGVGPDARLNYPGGVAVDGQGVVYFIDTLNYALRKLSLDGRVTTVAGQLGVSGTTDGAGSNARFGYASGLAIDSNGVLYVADSNVHTIRKITPAGLVSTFAGAAGLIGTEDGVGVSARFSSPTALAVGPDNTLYVTDSGNSTIRRILPNGAVDTLAGAAGMNASVNGPKATARLHFPRSIAYVAEGHFLLVTENSGAIRRVNLDGSISTFAGDFMVGETIDGPLKDARFQPSSMIAVRERTVFIAERATNTIRKIEPTGNVVTVAGKRNEAGAADGTGIEARFNFPDGIGAGPNGTLFVSDTVNSTLRRIDAGGQVSTVAGRPLVTGRVDGIGAAVQFRLPGALVVAPGGTLLVVDRNARDLVRVDLSGKAESIPLQPQPDGGVKTFGSITASVELPSGLIAWTEAIRRKVEPRCTGAVNLRRPDGQSRVFSLGVTAGCLSDIVSDSKGSLYVSDTDENVIYTVSNEGAAVVAAGKPGKAGALGSVDGPVAEARLSAPFGLARDDKGTLYFTEIGNHVIRRLTTSGQVETVAGVFGMPGDADGIGSAARFINPQGLAVRADGTVFVADTGNHTIRKIAPDGQVSTVMGVAGKKGTVLGALPATLASPQAVAVLPDGQLAVTTATAVVVTIGAQF
jgi:sugar lactone lactonase YvrE